MPAGQQARAPNMHPVAMDPLSLAVGPLLLRVRLQAVLTVYVELLLLVSMHRVAATAARLRQIFLLSVYVGPDSTTYLPLILSNVEIGIVV